MGQTVDISTFIEGVILTMIAREKLENNQIFLYVIVLLLAVVIGLFTPTIGKQLRYDFICNCYINV